MPNRFSGHQVRHLSKLGSAALRKLLDSAERKAEVCAQMRGRLGPGSSRARVTTENAKWARAAEQRDRLRMALELAQSAGL